MRQITERFRTAVQICTGPQHIKERLAVAWVDHLDNIEADMLPEIMRTQFCELRSAMYTEKPQPRESAPYASVRKMADTQAAIYTAAILKLWNDLQRISYASAPATLEEYESFSGAFQTSVRLN
jgi:hypothetical protein